MRANVIRPVSLVGLFLLVASAGCSRPAPPPAPEAAPLPVVVLPPEEPPPLALLPVTPPPAKPAERPVVPLPAERPAPPTPVVRPPRPTRPVRPIDLPVTIASGHSFAVEYAAYSPDGSLLATSDRNSTITLWDGTDFRPLRTIELPAEFYASPLAIRPDSTAVAAFWPGGEIRVWDVRSPGPATSYKVPAGTFGGNLAYAGTRLVVGRKENGRLRLWDVIGDKELVSVAGTGDDWFAALSNGTWELSADGKTLAVYQHFGGKAVFLWSVPDGKALGTFPLQEWGSPYQVALSRDGAKLATGSGSMLRVWDVPTGKALFEEEHSWVRALAFSPDGRFLASGCNAGERDGNTGPTAAVFVREAASGKLVYRWEVPGKCPSCLTFHPDGLTVVAGTDEHRYPVLWRWDVGTGERTVFAGHHDYVGAIAFSPDGRRLASGGGRTLCLWDTKTGMCRASWYIDEEVQGLAFSPDGRWLACGTYYGSAYLVLDAETGKVEGTPATTSRGHPRTVAFSPDGKHLAGGSKWGDGPWELSLWATAGLRDEPPDAVARWGTPRSVHDLHFSPDGARLASAEGHDRRTFDGREISGRVKIHDLASGRIIRGRVDGEHEVEWVRFSPDGKHLAWTNSVALKLWDLETDKEVDLTQVPEDKFVGALAFSPGGLLLATGGPELRIRELATGKIIESWKPPGGTPAGVVAFHPQGEMIAAGYKRSVRLLAFPAGWRDRDRARAEELATRWTALAAKQTAERKETATRLARRLGAADGRKDDRTEEARKALVGRWEGKRFGVLGSREIEVAQTWEFAADGTLKLTVTFPDASGYDDLFGANITFKAQTKTVEGKYTLIDPSLLRTEMPNDGETKVTHLEILALTTESLRLEAPLERNPKARLLTFTRLK